MLCWFWLHWGKMHFLLINCPKDDKWPHVWFLVPTWEERLCPWEPVDGTFSSVEPCLKVFVWFMHNVQIVSINHFWNFLCLENLECGSQCKPHATNGMIWKKRIDGWWCHPNHWHVVDISNQQMGKLCFHLEKSIHEGPNLGAAVFLAQVNQFKKLTTKWFEILALTNSLQKQKLPEILCATANCVGGS